MFSSPPRRREPPYALRILTSDNPCSPPPHAGDPSETLMMDLDPPPALTLQLPLCPPLPELDPSTTTSTPSSSTVTPSAPLCLPSPATMPSPLPDRPSRLSLRNTKNLHLSLAPVPASSRPGPRPKPSLPTLSTRDSPPSPTRNLLLPSRTPRRRRSDVSLLLSSTHHTEEGAPDHPYAEGPIEILPLVWLGSEENARDVPLLQDRGVRWVLCVAKEVDLEEVNEDGWVVESEGDDDDEDVEMEEGEEKMRYLKLNWSHGQQDLVRVGFVRAMDFVDRARASGKGVLVHCQCGVSRSATLAMALVMREAHRLRTSTADANASAFIPRPEDLRRVETYHDAYEYVKAKSQWAGPNIVLIHQLMDYAHELRASIPPPDPVTRTRTSSESTNSTRASTPPLFPPSQSWAPSPSLPHAQPHRRAESSSSSSPASYSPPTPPLDVLSRVPHSAKSPNREEDADESMGVEQWEALVLDRQMEVRREEALALRRAALARQAQTPSPGTFAFAVPPTPGVTVPSPSPTALSPVRQRDAQGLGIVPPPPPLPALNLVLPPGPLSRRPSRLRAASAESALSAYRARGMACLLEDEDES